MRARSPRRCPPMADGRARAPPFHPFRLSDGTSSEPVAAASAAAAAPPGTAPTSAATETAVATGPLLRLVDAELATVQCQPVELRDGFGSRLSITHGHEGKSSRPPRVPVDGNGHFTHFPGRGERCFQRRLVGFERKVSYEESISHVVLSSSDLWCGGTRLSRRRSRTRQRSADVERSLSASNPQPARSGPAMKQAGETDEGRRDGCSVACRGSRRKPERHGTGRTTWNSDNRGLSARCLFGPRSGAHPRAGSRRGRWPIGSIR